MADSDSNLDLGAEGQPLNRRIYNELANAMSTASYWAMRSYSSDDFTWAYYGGVINGTRYPNGELDLSSFASEAAVYIEHTLLGVVSANTSGFTAGSVRDYIAVTGASGVSSFVDVREQSTSIPVVGAYDSGTKLLRLTAPDGNVLDLGPFGAP